MAPTAGLEKMETMSSVWSIRRSTADKLVGGVCGGVARHWNVDPVLVRVGWVLLAFSGGIGIVLYAAAWLLVPADGATTSVLDDLTKGRTRDWPREAWVAIVAIACLLAFGVFGSGSTIGFWPAVVLALIWYFGYYRTRVKHAPPPPTPPGTLPTPPPSAQTPPHPGPTTPFTEAAEAWRQRVVDLRGGTDGGTTGHPAGAPGVPGAPRGAAAPPRPSSPPPYPGSGPATSAASGEGSWQTYPYDARPAGVQDPVSAETEEVAARAAFLAAPDPVGLYSEAAPLRAATAPSRRVQARSLPARRLRLVGLVVLGLVLLGLGVADATGIPVTPLVYAASALLVVGLTLVAATWFGRARGILPVGLLLLVAVAGLSVAGPASTFVHRVDYTSVGQLPGQPVAVDRGVLRVDLSRLDVTRDATFRADIGTGAVEIVPPADTNLVLDYSVDNGVVLDGDVTVASGEQLAGTNHLGRSVAGEPTLTLDIDVGQGVVAVRR